MHHRQTAYRVARGLLPGLALILTACATSQVKDLRQHTPQVPRFKELSQVPYYSQTRYFCGPATVATVMAHLGQTRPLEEIGEKVYLPGRRGSLQTDVVSALRRYGYLVYRLEPRLTHLIQEINAGRPIIVLQNLSLQMAPRWHYAVVIGYDLDREKLILRSGKRQRLLTPFNVFTRTWKRSDYWAIVVLKPGDLPVDAEPLAYFEAVSGLEQTQQWQAAHTAYLPAIHRWPDHHIPHTGIATALYHLNRLPEAERHYQHALRLKPDAADIHNNLASLLLKQKKGRAARTHAQKAVQLGGKNLSVYQRTLAQIEKALKRP